MIGPRLGTARRRTAFAVTATGVVLVSTAACGIGSGAVGQGMVAAFTALPGGLLFLLAGSDLLTRSTGESRSSRSVPSLDQWLGTAQSRRHAARAASN